MMLYEQVNSAPDDANLITATGCCRFCGQVATRRALAEWSQDDIDEMMTELCDCDDAQLYARRKKRKERAIERIEMLFGKGNGSVTLPDETRALLNEAADQVCKELLQSVTLDTGNGIKAKIGMTAKGSVKVERTITDKSAYEA